MLDTNIVSDLIRNPAGRASAKLALLPGGRVCTSILCVAELRYGIEKRGSLRLLQQMQTVLSRIAILAFDAPADIEYGRIRVHLERSGTIIGPNDLLIAAHALSLGLTLVTHNTAEFARVPGLVVEDWLA